MTITLINCDVKLKAMGIDMQSVGSGSLLEAKFAEKPIIWTSWEYDFSQDKLIITVADGTEIPDMSEFGEVVPDGDFMG